VQRTRTKFCGITRSQDALAAAAAGADAIGLIFYAKSSRYISIDQAKDILRILPPMVSPVGLFVNHSSDEIREIAKTLKLRTLQLHGDEPPEQLADLTDFTVIKAVRCDAQNLPTILQTWGAAALRWENLAGLLLETANTKDHGGTGIENDWATIESFAASQAIVAPADRLRWVDARECRRGYPQQFARMRSTSAPESKKAEALNRSIR